MTFLSIARFFPCATTWRKQVLLTYKCGEEFSTLVRRSHPEKTHAVSWVRDWTPRVPENIRVLSIFHTGVPHKIVFNRKILLLPSA